MTLEDIEREEQDRIQFELQLAGQGGKKSKVWPYGETGPADGPKAPRSVRVESSADYRLILRGVTPKD